MGIYDGQTLFVPPLPVSPEVPFLDHGFGGHHCPSRYQQSFGRGRSPMSPESIRSADSGDEGRRVGDEDVLFEQAIAALMKDRKIYSAMEPKRQSHSDLASTKTYQKTIGSLPVKKLSRDSKFQAAANSKSGKVLRPPNALCATHPALYNRPCPKPQRKMLPTPPPFDYPPENTLSPCKIKTEQAPSFPLPPWRTYTDPNRQISGEPQFDDPKSRMLKMDLEANRPNVLSPTFMIGLPCGSMVEAANAYPDAGSSNSRDPLNS